MAMMRLNYHHGKDAINTWTRNRMGARTYKLKIQKDSVYKLYWNTGRVLEKHTSG